MKKQVTELSNVTKVCLAAILHKDTIRSGYKLFHLTNYWALIIDVDLVLKELKSQSYIRESDNLSLNVKFEITDKTKEIDKINVKDLLKILDIIYIRKDRILAFFD